MLKYILIILLLSPFLSKAQDTFKIPKYKIVYLAKKEDLDALWEKCLATFSKKGDTSEFIRRDELLKFFHEYRKGLEKLEKEQIIPADNKHFLNPR